MLTIERRPFVGGGLETAEDPRHPGFLHNTHGFFQRALTGMPWYRDLDIARHGARYIEPELNVALLLGDGRSLQWWTDFERTHASFAALSKQDAATLKRWHDEFRPIVRDILVPEATSPPLPTAERRALLERSAAGRRLLEASALSPLEFVESEFTHPTIQAGLLFFNGLREVDLRVRGFGHHIAALLASTAKAQMTVGGAHMLAVALERAVREAGGDILVATTPRRILVERGRAVGVETDSGETIMARRFVASSLNPHQTFLDLLEPAHLPEDWRRKVEGFAYNLIAPLFALNLNLSEPPRYAAADNDPALETPFMVIMGLEHVAQYPEIVRHHEAGTIPPTVMWGACPTQFDPSQAPPGGHTAFMWEKLPYALDGDPASWDAAKDAHGAVMLDLWRRHAPNLDGAVIDRFTRSPLDVERTPAQHAPRRPAGRRLHRRPDRRRPPVPPRRRPLPRPSRRALSVRLGLAPGRQRHRPSPATTRPRCCSPISASRPAGRRRPSPDGWPRWRMGGRRPSIGDYPERLTSSLPIPISQG